MTSNQLQHCLLSVRELEKSFGVQKILAKLNFDIKNGDRIGLVGPNGAGKSTLANLLSGKLEMDNGTINYPNGYVNTEYLLQTVDYETHDYNRVIRDSKDKSFLELSSQLGLKKILNWGQQRIDNMSGGEKLKLSLAKVWAANPEFLILDEPTNHLDLEGVKWLVNELKMFNGAVLIISHDRFFLDSTVDQIFELDKEVLTTYQGTYTDYRTEKRRQHEEQLHRFSIQQKEKKRIETMLSKLENWSEKAHRNSTKQDGYKEYYRVKAKKMDIQVKSRKNRLQKELVQNKAENPKVEGKINFEFEEANKRGKRIIEARNLSKTIQNRTLFENSYFYLTSGERIGVVGPNGCGKSTLLKMLRGEETLSQGELWKSDSVQIGYLSQDVNDLNPNQTPLQALDLTTKEEIVKAKKLLANMGLYGHVLQQKIETLSLGQRTRLKLTGLLMTQHDVLILDEPTNHLDLPSREMLEETLADYNGTLILVTHDYYFLKKLCDKLLVFEHNTIKRVEMGIEELLEKTENRRQPQQENEHELMLIETRLTAILGELSLVAYGDEKYKLLDLEYQKLTKRKKDIKKS
ncbi:ribosomal protection-like ABC-F family protein [Metabacillus herbersteinensis]|uniref:Ribosomal protection-like ABC-F family protein n=1 Tax=Metabacillus herbersteinensis TaxID=283816 RepID=A0ABV6GAT8_9BACI